MTHRESTTTSAGIGSLKEFTEIDLSVPIDEVRDFLVARFERRKIVKPQVFEETVGSVFRDLGFAVRVTAFSGDDGIDVFLEKTGQKVGVQVKHTGRRIKVEQIRALAGALVLNNLTKGIFVSTSSFQRGAPSTADRYRKSDAGLEIELVDAPRLLAALEIAQRARYRSRSELPEQIQLSIVESRSHDELHDRGSSGAWVDGEWTVKER